MTISITESQVNVSLGTGKNSPSCVVYVASLDCVFALCSDCILKFTDPHNDLSTFTSAAMSYGTNPAFNNELIWVASKGKLYAAGGYQDVSFNAHAIIFEINPSDLSWTVVADQQLGDIFPSITTDETYFYLGVYSNIARFNYSDFAYVSQISLAAYGLAGISRIKYQSGKLYVCCATGPNSPVARVDTATFGYEEKGTFSTSTASGFAFVGNYLYVGAANTDGNNIAVFTKAALTSNYMINTGILHNVASIYSYDGSAVYAGTSFNPSELIVVEPGSGNNVSSHTMSAGPAISSIYQGSDGRELFVVHLSSPGAISRLDVAQNYELQLQDDLDVL